jgi:predicted NAD-dependent protein-ADP-ribosyltransferase YbiA (DUF1768 family)
MAWGLMSIVKYEHVCQKGCLSNWTEEIFEISGKKYPTYSVRNGQKDLASEDIKGIFTNMKFRK